MKRSPAPEYVLRNFNTKPSSIKSMCMLQNLDELLTSDDDGNIKLWDLSIRRVKMCQQTSTPITSIRVLENSIISQTKDGVSVWYRQESGFIKSGYMEDIGVTFCSCELMKTDTGSTLVCIPGKQQSTMNILNFATEQSIRMLKPADELGMCMCAKFIESNGKLMILIGYESGHLLLWDCSNGEAVDKCKLHNESLLCFDIHSSMTGISGSVDNKIVLWMISESKIINRKTDIDIINVGINCVKIREDGMIFVTGGWDYNIRIFNFKKMKQLAVLCYHSKPVNCLIFDTDKMLYVGSEDGQISVWSIYRNK